MQNMKINDKNQEWIGNIPKNWTFKKIKYVLAQRNEKNIPIKSKDILSLTAKQGVIPYTEKEGGGNKPKTDFSAYKLAYPGDIVMNSMNILSGAVGLSKYFGCVSPVYYMLYCSNDEDDIRYFYYVFANKAFQSSLLGIGNGILMKESENGTFNTIRMRIPIEKLNNMSIPYPKPEIQKAIANFLDKKIGKIDEVSKKIQQEITDLEKYRKSIITKAVTKGLNPNVPMKNSNISWIGEVPSNWHIEKLKFIAETRNNKELLSNVQNNYIGLENIVKNTGQYVCSNTTYEEGYYDVCKKGDILYGKLRPNLSKVLVAPFDSCCSGEFLIFKSAKINLKYLFYYLLSQGITEIATSAIYGTKMPRVSWDFIKNLFISFPPKNEDQKEIVNYLDIQCNKIDSILKNKHILLKKLNQYKQSIIYEYVTGKKQVPTEKGAKK